MHLSTSTAQTHRPFASCSSMMQSATGQAAWQIEQANAPKQLSGSMTAIVFGNFLRGTSISLVHMGKGIIPDCQVEVVKLVNVQVRYALFRHAKLFVPECDIAVS